MSADIVDFVETRGGGLQPQINARDENIYHWRRERAAEAHSARRIYGDPNAQNGGDDDQLAYETRRRG